MRYVVDASVALKWVLPEPDAAKAIVLRDEFRSGIHQFLAHETFAVEVAHALTRAERRGILRPPQALHRLRNILSTVQRLHRSLPLLSRAVELSSLHRIGVYDCLYIALAEREQCALVTADSRLASIGFPSVVLLGNLP